MGMFYNIEKEDTIYLEIDKAIEEAQAIDKQLHTKEQIILRELINYECFYICDFTDVVEPLQAYGYTLQDIQPIFIKYLQKIFRMKNNTYTIANGLSESRRRATYSSQRLRSSFKKKMRKHRGKHSAEERSL